MKKITLLIMLGLSSNALAADAVVVVGSVLQPGVMAISQSTAKTAGTTSKIAGDTGSMNQVLMQNFGGGSGYVNGQLDNISGKISAQTEAMAQLIDLNADNMYELARATSAEQVNREESVGTQLIDICRQATSARHTVSAGKKQKVVNATINEASTLRSTSAVNGSAAVSNITKGHVKYCSATDAALLLCEAPGKHANADVKVSTLMTGAVGVESEVELIKYNNVVVGIKATPKVPDEQPVEKLTFNAEDLNASSQLINNIVNPYPDNQSLTMVNGGDPKLVADYQADYLVRQARIDVAQNSFNSVQADRVPVFDLAGWKDIISKEGGDASALDEKSVNGKISMADKLAFDVSRRADNPEWFVSMAEKTSGQKDTEILAMLALIAKLQHEQLKVMERDSLVNATILAHTLSPVTKADLEKKNPDSDY